MLARVFPLLTLRPGWLRVIAHGVIDTLPDCLGETTAGGMDFLPNHLMPQIVGQSFANPLGLAQLLIPWRGPKRIGKQGNAVFRIKFAKKQRVKAARLDHIQGKPL